MSAVAAASALAPPMMATPPAGNLSLRSAQALAAFSALRLPILRDLDEAGLLSFCKQHALQLIAADGQADTEHLDVDWTRPSCIVLGHDASGVPTGLAGGAEVLTRIPLAPSVESLNVAVATGVLLFEAQRQRR